MSKKTVPIILVFLLLNGFWAFAQVRYAKGFTLQKHGQFTVLKVIKPWPGAKQSYTYVLKRKGVRIPKAYAQYTQVVVPVQRMIATSTTHLPSIESLGMLPKLVGFPHTDYISSAVIRQYIEAGKLTDVGSNTDLNIEKVLALRPDAFIGYGVDRESAGLLHVKNQGIPIIMNGDWNEEDPLGKAEWIKFFGALFDQQTEANKQFDRIEKAYLTVRNLAAKTKARPRVFTGALWEGIWHLPKGNSWVGQLLRDAGSNYLWQNTHGTGSLSLSLEQVLAQAQNADFWVAPGGFDSRRALLANNAHYQQFKAFQNNKVYTYSLKRGKKGGILYYELAPNRPDLVLKDLVHLFHPELFPGYKPYFYQSLQDE